MNNSEDLFTAYFYFIVDLGALAVSEIFYEVKGAGLQPQKIEIIGEKETTDGFEGDAEFTLRVFIKKNGLSDAEIEATLSAKCNYLGNDGKDELNALKAIAEYDISYLK